MATNTPLQTTDITPRKPNPAHWTKDNKPLGKPINSENARALARLRWEKARSKVQEAVAREGRSVDPDVYGDGYDYTDAWAQLAGAQYAALLGMAREGKARVEQTVALGQVIGTMPRMDEVQQQDSTGASAAQALGAGLLALVRMLGSDQGSGVVDADYTEAEAGAEAE